MLERCPQMCYNCAPLGLYEIVVGIRVVFEQVNGHCLQSAIGHETKLLMQTACCAR